MSELEKKIKEVEKQIEYAKECIVYKQEDIEIYRNDIFNCEKEIADIYSTIEFMEHELRVLYNALPEHNYVP